MAETFFLINAILTIVVGILCLGLGFWVLSSNSRLKVNVFFFWTSLFLFLWILACYLGNSIFITTDPLWGRIAYGVVALFFIPFYFFSTSFLQEYKKNIKMDFFLIFSSLFLFTISISGNFMVKNMAVTQYGAIPVLGKGAYAYFSLIFFWFLYIAYRFLVNYFKSKANARAKLVYFLFGFFVWVLANLIFNVILPFFQGIPQFWAIGNYSALIFLSFTAYAIVKHRLIDIKVIFVKSFAFFLLVMTLAIAYTAFIYAANVLVFGEEVSIGHQIFRIAVVLVLIFSFQPIKIFIAKITDKFFFKNQYRSEEFLNEIGEEISSTIILHEILFKVFRALEITIKTSRILFAIADEQGNLKDTYAVGFGKLIKLTPKEFDMLKTKMLLDEYELADSDPRKALLKKYDSGISFVLKTKSYLAGVMLIGHKKSGESYSPEDIKVLHILSNQLTVAIQNACQYEEIKNFACTLEEKVEKSTAKLLRANEHLKELDKAKDQFLAMASHQLRTPLTTIAGYLHMLVEGDFGDLTVTQLNAMQEAYLNTSRMERLIDDLLNISRIDTGKFFMQGELIDIAEIAAEEVAHLRERAESRQLFLKLEVLTGKRKKMMIDKLKMGQVISNFIENAIFYTRDGGITVVVDKDDKGMIVLVKDTGIGVPGDQQKDIFKKFFRGSNAQQIRPDGSGLGLFLAKEVIEGHKGNIYFDSKPGKGCTFGFFIPWETGIEKSQNSQNINAYRKASK